MLLVAIFYVVATVLTVYGIETYIRLQNLMASSIVATVLTVYGIETSSIKDIAPYSCWLQQYLPFTVLKLCFYR